MKFWKLGRWAIAALVVTAALAAGCDDESYSSGEVNTDAGTSASNTSASNTSASNSAADTGADDAARDTEAAPDTVELPDTAPTMDSGVDSAAPDVVEDTSTMMDDCPTLGPDACIASSDCVLDWTPEATPLYRCRAPQDNCERIMEQGACEGSGGLCQWHPADCYCPEGAVCGCGDGPAAICRSTNAEVVCALPSQGCAQGDTCCAEEGARVGVCAAPDACDGGPVICASLRPDACYASARCVLDWNPAATGADSRYACRDPRNDCERAMARDACEAADGCLWYPENCYCPEDADCDCGDGPAAICRPEGEVVACDGVSGWGCSQGAACCTTDGEQLGLGVCAPGGACAEASGCDVLVSMETTGGLCAFGACGAEVWVRADGHVTLNTEAPDSPRDFALTEAQLSELEATLDALDRVRVANGYGTCCNAFTDGSDDYITLYALGAPVRTIRISSALELPDPLASLLNQLRALRFSDAIERDAAPGVWHPSELDLGAGAGLTCDDFEEASAGIVVWSLSGPDGQRFDRSQIAVDALGDVSQEDLMAGVELVLEGTAVLNPDGEITVETAEGATWSLTFERYPGALPQPRLVTGEPVRITARVAWAFDLNIHGLMLEGPRGVLFITDEGLSGLHAAQTAPFAVAPTGDCPVLSEEGCAPRQARSLRFAARDGGAQELELLTGQWGVWRVPGAYDLAVRNLRSYETGFCDDYWNYAYLAVPLAGSDVGACPGGVRP